MTLSVAISGLGCLLGDSIAALRVPVPASARAEGVRAFEHYRAEHRN